MLRRAAGPRRAAVPWGQCLLAAVLAAGTLPGCNDPVISKGWARREQNRQELLRELSGREGQGEARVAESLAMIDRRLKQDAERTRGNQGVLRDLLTAEFRRWERRHPLYRQAVQEELSGDRQGMVEGVRYILE